VSSSHCALPLMEEEDGAPGLEFSEAFAGEGQRNLVVCGTHGQVSSSCALPSSMEEEGGALPGIAVVGYGTAPVVSSDGDGAVRCTTVTVADVQCCDDTVNFSNPSSTVAAFSSVAAFSVDGVQMTEAVLKGDFPVFHWQLLSCLLVFLMPMLW
ncbi:hypothetical protein Dimus_036601, partial [Dionaea muscipula]